MTKALIQIKHLPITIVARYRCRICGEEFHKKTRIRLHLLNNHQISSGKKSPQQKQDSVK